MNSPQPPFDPYGQPYGQQPYSQYPGTPPPPQQGSGKAIAALVLGICGVFAGCLPIVGLPVNVIGLIFGLVSLKSSKRGFAIAGIILSLIGLLLTIANAVAGIVMVLNDQHPLITPEGRFRGS